MNARTTPTANPRASIVVEGHGNIECVDIEYRRIDGPANAPLIVFLHEGLGSVSMWRDFPDRLCAQGNYRGLVFSRPGYGTSTPRAHGVEWSADFMHRQATLVLPPLFAALGIDVDNDPPWLFGHSDGASIALIHAASFPAKVAGLIVLAPHLDVEQFGVDSIAETRIAYLETDLRDKLARHHADVDSAFWGWNDVWLSTEFKRDFDIRALLPRITCPVLAIQGIDDQYGTMAHIDGIATALPETELLKLEHCGHSSHRDQPEAVIDAAHRFIDAHAHVASSGLNQSEHQHQSYKNN
jgi:pimeloyl-ACP methyl ester carboxylesterase